VVCDGGLRQAHGVAPADLMAQNGIGPWFDCLELVWISHQAAAGLLRQGFRAGALAVVRSSMTPHPLPPITKGAVLDGARSVPTWLSTDDCGCAREGQPAGRPRVSGKEGGVGCRSACIEGARRSISCRGISVTRSWGLTAENRRPIITAPNVAVFSRADRRQQARKRCLAAPATACACC